MNKFKFTKDLKINQEVLDLIHQNAIKSIEHADHMNELINIKNTKLVGHCGFFDISLHWLYVFEL